MKGIYSRSSIESGLKSAFSNSGELRKSIQDPVPPQDISDWLGLLDNLHGVPFNYLVPDETMLPPESIRFFYLDSNWVATLLDGAQSIGRNLTADSQDNTTLLDKAVRPEVLAEVRMKSGEARPKLFGLQGTPPTMNIISGFVLRSSLVKEYTNMGVDVYPYFGPDDPLPQMLDIKRFDRLGPNSDTMICLVTGDAYRVDIHEAPQALHYGIDCFNNGCSVDQVPAVAVKNLYTFTVDTTTVGEITSNSITMSETPTPVDISASIRPDVRVVSMSNLASLILQANQQAARPSGTQPPENIDSATMGFEMTEGVGMVSFYKTN